MMTAMDYNILNKIFEKSTSTVILKKERDREGEDSSSFFFFLQKSAGNKCRMMNLKTSIL